MSKLKEPTYKRFITGPLERFDKRNSVNPMSYVSKEEASALEANKDVPVHKDYGWRLTKIGRKGYEQKDYAFLWGARTINDLVNKHLYSRDFEVAKTKVDVSDKVAMTQQVKSVARWLGADLVGVCELNPSWVYSHWGNFSSNFSDGTSKDDPIEIPSWAKYAVVMAVEMDYEAIKLSPAVQPSPSMGYSRMAFVAPSLATYIRELGYHAIPSGNDFALNIPLAVDAGLGELGRNGLLITEQYGPRVRICKVFTELPLEVDSPLDMGVQAFCETCKLCADKCPSKAIISGERTDKPWNGANNINVLKWPINAVDCQGWWHKNESSCSNCIRVCPYNKPEGWLHSIVKKTVKTTPLFNRFFIKMDQAMGYGKQVIK